MKQGIAAQSERAAGSTEKAKSEGRGENRHELVTANYMTTCTSNGR